MKLYQRILTHIMAVLIATALIYVYEIRTEVKDINRRLEKLEKATETKRLAYRNPTFP